jgi:cellulose synthase/poly-beta-1,6-N-acetylglucosamine synthase-like glycosyltransferase
VVAGLSFVVLLRWCAIQTMAFTAQYKLWRTGYRPPIAWPLVSILVPAYQESDTIASALRSLLQLDYPRYEIIIVDDGSLDDTFAKASAFVGDHGCCSVQLHRKLNGGKWSALNFAFRCARGELILCIDADSRLNSAALKHLVSRMDGPDIMGVSGQITVRNRRNIITRLQAYEYIVANGGLRTAQSLLGSVLVVPGPIGLYRRVALQDAWATSTQMDRPLRPGDVEGPFSHETFAEDFQLSLTVLASGGRIVYEPRALSYTRSPDLTHSLISQRYRWFRGTMQVLRIYNKRLRSSTASRTRGLSLLITVIYLLDLFILPGVNLILIVGFVISAITSVPVTELILWVSAVWLLNLMTGTYHILAQGDDPSLLHLVPIYDLYHGLLVNSAWAIALLDEIRHSKMHW